jgi:hypothetical protein
MELVAPEAPCQAARNVRLAAGPAAMTQPPSAVATVTPRDRRSRPSHALVVKSNGGGSRRPPRKSENVLYNGIGQRTGEMSV